jgi:hypothetical protein
MATTPYKYSVLVIGLIRSAPANAIPLMCTPRLAAAKPSSIFQLCTTYCAVRTEHLGVRPSALQQMEQNTQAETVSR